MADISSSLCPYKYDSKTQKFSSYLALFEDWWTVALAVENKPAVKEENKSTYLRLSLGLETRDKIEEKIYGRGKTILQLTFDEMCEVLKEIYEPHVSMMALATNFLHRHKRKGN